MVRQILVQYSKDDIPKELLKKLINGLSDDIFDESPAKKKASSAKTQTGDKSDDSGSESEEEIRIWTLFRHCTYLVSTIIVPLFQHRVNAFSTLFWLCFNIISDFFQRVWTVYDLVSTLFEFWKQYFNVVLTFSQLDFDTFSTRSKHFERGFNTILT